MTEPLVASTPNSPVWIIEPSRGWASLNLRELWAYRELLYFLTWRDVKVRYRQTALGMAWVILQPVISVLVFTLLFGRLLKVPSDGLPYPVFALAALVPWTFFAGALTRCSVSLVSSAHLITKVYFPRLAVPLSAILAALVDFGVSFLALLGLMLYYGRVPSRAVVFVPLLMLWAIVVTIGFGLWLAALNVRFRDVNHIVPVLLQLWMYVTPVIYSSTLVPERFRPLLALNPMTGIVEGFRWALLGSGAGATTNATTALMTSLPLVLVVFATGLGFFRATERTFADVV